MFFDKIISWSVNSRYTILGILSIWVAWGLWSLSKLDIDAIPDITNKQVVVITLSPSLGPMEVENFVTTPIELEMSNIKGMSLMRSISKFGLSSVTLVFEDEIDLFWARQQVFERLSTVKDNLPSNAGNPQLAPITTGIGEVYQYVVVPENPNDTSFSLAEIRTLQDWVVRKNILGTPGIADVSSFGGYKKEYQCVLIPERLNAYGISIDELYEAIQNGNNNTGGAYIEKDNKSFVIRGVGLATTIEDIKNTFVKIHDNSPVLVGQVCKVVEGNAIRYGAMTMDGKGEVVGGVVLLQMGDNASKVIDQLEIKLEQIKKLLPKGITIKPFINRKALVGRTIQTVTKNLVEGALVVLVVLMLFLGDWRASVVAASVIPLSMLATFGLMCQFGVIGNLMSLGALDFGLIVDGSVIVVESIAMVFAIKMHGGHKIDYEERKRATIVTLSSSKQAVIFGTLIILVVYAPILFLSGVEGKMFRPMAMTVIFAIVTAFILSLTYVPMLSAWMMSKPHKEGGFSDRFVDFLYYKLYKKPLLWSMRHKMQVFGFTMVVFSLAIYTFLNIGGEFIPKLDEGDFQIETRLPVGSSLNQSIETTLKIEKKLLEKFPDEIVSVIGKTGTSEIPLDPVPMESTDMIFMLSDKKNWKKAHSKSELLEKIMAEYEGLPGITPTLQQPIEARFNDLLSGAKTDVVFKVYGNDLKKMNQVCKDIMSTIRNIDGAVDVQMQRIDGLPQVKITYNRKNIALYGISVDQVNKVIETSFAGKTAGMIYQADRRYDLTLRMANEDRNNIEQLKNLPLRDFKGNLIPLKQLAKIELIDGPSEIRHVDKKRCIQVGCNVRGRDMESLVMEAKQLIKKEVTIPQGCQIEIGGQFENLKEAKARLSIVLPIALAVIYFLLFISFRSHFESILIFTAVPMSAIGGIFSLYLTNINFSISAGVGFICLFGIAVLNGIMLIGQVKMLKSLGLNNNYKNLIVATKEKFRPILMTSFVAALGFMPMALATGAGAEVQKPLAIVVIGGLLVSTILTLIVLPTIYLIFSKKSKQ
ncbi:MAG: CusA/CzcA family heavy metal efflux RND transporter [Cytophagales bacterium]